MDNEKSKPGTGSGKSHEDFEPKIFQMYENHNWEKIHAVTYEEMVSSNPEPIRHILHPWLPEQGLALIYAATGIGKTLFTLNVAYAIAAGGSFLKYTAPLPRRVLYVDGEMSYKEVHERFTTIRKQQGEMHFKQNWRLLTPDKVMPFRLPKISDLEGQAFYNQKIEEYKTEVLILDNMATLACIEESNTEQWLIIQNWFLDLRARNVCVIFVHHSSKDPKNYRGTSRMLDCLNTAISLQSTQTEELENDIIKAKKFKIKYEKARGFGGKDALEFDVSLTDHGWNFQSMEHTIVEKVAERIKIGMTHREIALELGTSRPYVSKIVAKGRQMGIIISD